MANHDNGWLKGIKHLKHRRNPRKSSGGQKYQEKVLHRSRPTEIHFRFAKWIFHLYWVSLRLFTIFIIFINLPQEAILSITHGTTELLPSLLSFTSFLHPSSSLLPSVSLLIYYLTPLPRLPVLMPFPSRSPWILFLNFGYFLRVPFRCQFSSHKHVPSFNKTSALPLPPPPTHEKTKSLGSSLITYYQKWTGHPN